MRIALWSYLVCPVIHQSSNPQSSNHPQIHKFSHPLIQSSTNPLLHHSQLHLAAHLCPLLQLHKLVIHLTHLYIVRMELTSVILLNRKWLLTHQQVLPHSSIVGSGWWRGTHRRKNLVRSLLYFQSNPIQSNLSMSMSTTQMSCLQSNSNSTVCPWNVFGVCKWQILTNPNESN